MDAKQEQKLNALLEKYDSASQKMESALDEVRQVRAEIKDAGSRDQALVTKFDDLSVKFMEFLSERTEIKSKIDELGSAVTEMKSGDVFGGSKPASRKSLGLLLVESDEYNDYIKSGAKGRFEPVEVKDAALNLGGIGTVSELDPVFPAQTTPRIRDYIRTRQIDTTSVQYVKETGSYMVYGQLKSSTVIGATTFTLKHYKTDDGSEFAGTAGLAAGYPVTLSEGTGNEEIVTIVTVDSDYQITTSAATKAHTAGDTATSTKFSLTDEMKIKPRAQSDFTMVTEATAVLATWIPVTNQILRDRGALVDRINSRLIRKLQLQEERQMLYGTGVSGVELNGIMVNSDVPQYLWSSGATGDTKIDALRKAITVAWLGEYAPEAIFVHPLDWQDIDAAKDSNGAYLFKQGTTGSNIGAGNSIFGLPVVQTSQIDQGDFCLGAFSIGCELLERESISISVADQHADFKIRNMKLVLVEESVAFPTMLPEALVRGKFDSAP